MLVLNFSHPLTPEQLSQPEALTGQRIERVVEIPTRLDTGKPFAPQVAELAERTDFSPTEWQTLPILAMPPALNFAILLPAELHGRIGYFLPSIRLRPEEGAVPSRYEVAEVRGRRDAARRRRGWVGSRLIRAA